MRNLKKKAISMLCSATMLMGSFNMPTACNVYANNIEYGTVNGALANGKVSINENAADWTYGIYMCGSTLESANGYASADIIEILNAKVPKKFSEHVNIVIETGGSMNWKYSKKYKAFLKEKGLSETEIEKVNFDEIDTKKIQLFKVNYEHEYETDEGEIKTVPAIEHVKDIAEYKDEVEEEFDITEENSDSENNENFDYENFDYDDIDFEGITNDLNGDTPSNEENIDENKEDYHGDDFKYNEYGENFNLDENGLFEYNVDMGDEEVLLRFMSDLDKEYPAKHNAIELWNHGGGITGGVCYDSYSSDSIDFGELKDVFDTREFYGYGKYDLLGFDACLMSDYEIWMEMSKYAQYGVGSILNIPVDGWYYTPFVEDLANNYDNKKYSGKELSSKIVDAYADYYKDGGICEKMHTEKELEEFPKEATLCAIDLENLSYTKYLFDNIAANLVKASEHDDTVKRVFDEFVDKGMIGENFGDINSYLSAVKTVLEEKTKELSYSPNIFESHNGVMYNDCISQADMLKDNIEQSLVNNFSKCDYDDLGVMSLFCPDISYYAYQTADFNIYRYSNYSVSDYYTTLVYWYSKEIEEKQNEFYEVGYEYDSKNNKITASIPEDVAKFDGKFRIEKYLNKDGKIYYVTDERYSYMDSITVDATLHYPGLDGKPIIFMPDLYGEEQDFTLRGDLNGKLGTFCFTLDDKKKNYMFQSFISDEDLYSEVNTEIWGDLEPEEISDELYEEFLKQSGFIYELKPGDRISTNSLVLEDYAYNGYWEFYDEIPKVKGYEEKAEYVITKDDFVSTELYGNEFSGCNAGIKAFKADDKDAVYIFSSIHFAGPDFEDYGSELNIYPFSEDYWPYSRTINLEKMKAYVNANVSIEKSEFELTGENIEPKVTLDGTDFVQGKDYEVYYENNLGLGMAKVYIIPVGDYDFLPTKTVDFKIVKAKNADGKIVYKTVVVKAPKKAKIKSLKNKKKNALTVKWKKVKGASGYQIKYALNKKFSKGKKIKNIKNAKKVSATIKNLKKKTYYVKVRAYTLDPNGKKVYGAWSKAKKIKIIK